MIHGEEKTVRTRVGASSGTIYTKRVRFCAAHGWIDLFYVGGAAAWEARHGKCNRLEQPAAIGLKLPQEEAKAMTVASAARLSR